MSYICTCQTSDYICINHWLNRDVQAVLSKETEEDSVKGHFSEDMKEDSHV